MQQPLPFTDPEAGAGGSPSRREAPVPDPPAWSVHTTQKTASSTSPSSMQTSSNDVFALCCG